MRLLGGFAAGWSCAEAHAVVVDGDDLAPGLQLPRGVGDY